VPRGTWIPHIEASPHDAGTAFVVFDNHRRSDMKPYALVATDHGQRWRSLITGDVRGYCLAIEQDPVDPDLLFLGTEFGLYVSVNGGKRWMRWTHGVPTASVMDLVVHPRDHDLVLGTHGRSAYVIDDIAPLRGLREELLARPLHLFAIPPARQHVVKQEGASRFPGVTEFRGENRPYGALITFSVADADLPHPDTKVERERQIAKRERERMEEEEEALRPARPDTAEVEEPPAAGRGPGGRPGDDKPKIRVLVRDAAGDTIRTFERPVYRGVNRIAWDLKADAFKTPPPSTPRTFDFEPEGPEVLPGEYEVTLRYKGQEASGRVTVLPDPRLDIPDEDRLAAWEAVRRAGRVQNTATQAIQRIVDARAEIDHVLGQIERIAKEQRAGRAAEPGVAGPYADLKQRAEGVKRGLGKLESELRRPAEAKGIPGDIYIWSDVANAMDFLTSTWDRPSPGNLEYLEQAETRLAGFLERYNRYFAEDVAGLREEIAGATLPGLGAGEPVKLPDTR
jgi:hypothetical protein